MDATGRFPVMSHAGHEYQLIMYSEGSNYIKVLPMKSRNKASYLAAHKKGLAWFEEHGFKPTFQRMDNETSQEFATHLRTHGIRIELAPPHMHRRNRAERAIRTWKNHFIATIAGVDPKFPMCAWNELIDQAEITINLLRASPSQPRQSAWEAIHGPYDFDAHPMAPPGTAVTIHEKPTQRKSWGKHGVAGFYLGPAMQYYRCYTVWTTHSGSTRTADTLAWHPHGYKWKEYSPLDMVTSMADALSTAMHHLATHDPTTAAQQQPLEHIAHDIKRNFEALKNIYTPPPPQPSDPEPAQPQQVEIPSNAQDMQPVQRVEEHKEAERVAENAPLQRVQESAPAQVEDSDPVQRVVDTDQPQCTPTAAPDQRVAADTTKPAVQTAAPAPAARSHTTEATAAPAAPPAGARRHSKRQKRPPPSPEQRRSQRQKHQWLNRANQIVQTRSNWAAWARQSRNIALDSSGVPFFLPTARLARHSANTAVDLDDKGKKLSMTTALAGEDGHLWLAKHGEEITRLFASDTIKLIHWHDLPSDKKPAYYNPQVRTKIKEGKLVRRVRGTIGGDQIKERERNLKSIVEQKK
jgi:hypothetical protein